MSIIYCNQGHYYDSSKNTTCPFCSGQGPSVGVTQHISNAGPGYDISVTQHLSPDERNVANDIPVTRALYGGGNPERGDITVGLIKDRTGIDPVVGWLVCVEGAIKGQDYRIRNGQNFIGRENNMHICIKGDQTISREKHAAIIFDLKNTRFYIQNGEGRDLVYLNGEPVLTATELHAYDTLEIGKTRLLFVPFCREEFKWE